MRVKHNKNSTFYWAGDVLQQSDGSLVDLSQYDIVSQIRNTHGVINLPVYKNDPQQGFIRIQADSSAWACGDYLWDVLLSKGGITVATQTVNLTVVDGGTHA